MRVRCRPRRRREAGQRRSGREVSTMSPRKVDGVYGRAIAILDLLVMRWPESVGVREVSVAVELPRTTVNRILMGLADVSACRVVANGRYRLGYRIMLAAWVASRQNRWFAAVRGQMTALAAATGETALLALLDERGYARLVDVAESAKPLRYRVDPGTPVPITKGALGRAMVGAMTDTQFDLISKTGRFDGGDAVVRRSRAEARKSLSDNGFLVSIGERIPEALGVSAPIVVDDRVLGSLAITIPRARESDIDFSALGAATSATARQLSRVNFRDDPGGADAVESPFCEAPRSIVARLVATFDRVALRGQLAISELESIANCTPPTAHRLVEETVSNGLFNSDGKGLVGGSTSLAWTRALADLNPLQIQSGVLAALAARFNETVALGLLDATDRSLRISQTHASPQPIHYSLTPGDRLPLHAGAAGKVVLANLPAHTWPREPKPLTGATITDFAALAAD